MEGPEDSSSWINEKEGECEDDPFLEKYPKMGLENLRNSKRAVIEFLSNKMLDSLNEVNGDFEESPRYSEESLGGVSVDRTRIEDPKGTQKMVRRWSRLLSEILGSDHSGFHEASSEIEVSVQTESVEPNGRGEGLSLPGGEATSVQDEEELGGTDGCREQRLGRKNRPEIFWTRSRYEGQWNEDLDVPWGRGVYRLPYGVTYAGDIWDGQLDGVCALRYSDGTMVEGVWKEGRLEAGAARVTFGDALVFDEEDWTYCKYPDRRFHIERLYGLRGAGRTHLTQGYPTREVPAGCYDTGDGFYNPKTRCVVSADVGKVLR